MKTDTDRFFGILCRRHDDRLPDLIEEFVRRGVVASAIIIEDKKKHRTSRVKSWFKQQPELTPWELLAEFSASALRRFRSIRSPQREPERPSNFDAVAWCRRNDIQHLYAQHNSRSTKEFLMDNKITDLLLLSGGIIQQEILSLDGLYIYNAHPGYLPQHRGLGSFEWSLIEGAPLAISFHLLDRGIDTGPIIKVAEVCPEKGETISNMRRRMEAMMPRHFAEIAERRMRHPLMVTPQLQEEGVRHRRLTRRERQRAEEALSRRHKHLKT